MHAYDVWLYGDLINWVGGVCFPKIVMCMSYILVCVFIYLQKQMHIPNLNVAFFVKFKFVFYAIHVTMMKSVLFMFIFVKILYFLCLYM